MRVLAGELTPETRMPIGWVVGALVLVASTVGGGTWSLATRLTALQADQAAMQVQLRQLDERLAHLADVVDQLRLHPRP